jgi:hypothetical protein
VIVVEIEITEIKLLTKDVFRRNRMDARPFLTIPAPCIREPPLVRRRDFKSAFRQENSATFAVICDLAPGLRSKAGPLIKMTKNKIAFLGQPLDTISLERLAREASH